jgi:hypothetical protein
VLHRARTERIETGVEIEVAPRQLVVVADDLGLRDLRQLGSFLPQHRGGNQVVERPIRNVERR